MKLLVPEMACTFYWSKRLPDAARFVSNIAYFEPVRHDESSTHSIPSGRKINKHNTTHLALDLRNQLYADTKSRQRSIGNWKSGKDEFNSHEAY
jgi:hypothetical protein